MADLKQRVEALLEGRGELTEARVLSGSGLFVDGRLVAAVMGEDLCVQVGEHAWVRTLSRPGVEPLLFADRPVPGWVVVAGPHLVREDDLAGWLELGMGG